MKFAVFSIFREKYVNLSIFADFFGTAMKIQSIGSKWLLFQNKWLKVH